MNISKIAQTSSGGEVIEKVQGSLKWEPSLFGMENWLKINLLSVDVDTTNQFSSTFVDST